jgi:hypothetical protein
MRPSVDRYVVEAALAFARISTNATPPGFGCAIVLKETAVRRVPP